MANAGAWRCTGCGDENVATATHCAGCGMSLPVLTYGAVPNLPPIPSALENLSYASPIATSGRVERGGCLTAWLCLVMLFSGLNILSVPLALFVSKQLTKMGMDASMVMPTALVRGGFSVVILMAAIAMWQGHKWGVFLFLGLQVVSLGLALRNFGSEPEAGLMLILSVVAAAVFYIIVRRRWAFFQ